MGKVNGCEKFFINIISNGFEKLGKELSLGDIEFLLTESIEIDKKTKKEFNTALSLGCKVFDDNMVEENVLKICKDRDINLKSIVVSWYSNEIKPSILEKIKKLIKI